MSGRRIRDLRRWRTRLAGSVLSVMSVMGPSTPAWATERGLLPRHPRVADAQLVVPVPRAMPEPLVRPAQTPALAARRDTAAPMSAEPALPFDALVRRAAQVASVDAALLHAIIDTESGYDPQAVSVRGAIGLMQVLPRTGERFGVRRLEDPAENVRAGASYVRWLLSRFDGDLTLALAAYNAGEGAVLRYGRQIPPFPETQNYVRKVMAGYARLRDASPEPVVPKPPLQTTRPVRPMKPVQPAAVLADTKANTNAPAGATRASERGDVGSDGAATARAWRLLRGVGALLTRSPSAEAAGDHGRDRPAVVMPSHGRDDRSAVGGPG
ncbi:lytic transglycosylase domain-containing protein [Pandoraea terrigena]|uniref:Soluble lytic murein transglycosylase n=1 Tax=Pandoraea terrigena TaxID=2508292 RepID=A0A5E4YHD4_9BURK|nr:lytic transglycosylase domain-containing protein [Pandoraea terrigena]VVE47453.1 Soluble lytic murein transglycosylase [Pandoraea terrigena]